MKKIFKYTFLIVRDIQLVLPKNAEILSVQLHDGEPCMWALVDPDAATETRYFKIHGTGHEVTAIEPYQQRIHISTFQDGEYVWHLFEIKH